MSDELIGGPCKTCGQQVFFNCCGQETGGINRAAELQLDVTAEGARALQRVVRAMHDGHCPKCGHLGSAELFVRLGVAYSVDHVCPVCKFEVSEEEAKAALAAFHPHFSKSVEVFETWRSGRKV